MSFKWIYFLSIDDVTVETFWCLDLKEIALKAKISCLGIATYTHRIFLSYNVVRSYLRLQKHDKTFI